MIYLVQIIVPFTQMATFFTALQKALGATERITAVLEEPTESEFGKDVPNTAAPIRFEGVHFQYNEQPVLKGMTFTIQPNKTTAFVSGSGGGKTTMFSLIERFYNVTRGSIYYGADPIEAFNLNSGVGFLATSVRKHR